jgi:hypothetical protein
MPVMNGWEFARHPDQQGDVSQVRSNVVTTPQPRYKRLPWQNLNTVVCRKHEAAPVSTAGDALGIMTAGVA